MKPIIHIKRLFCMIACFAILYSCDKPKVIKTSDSMYFIEELPNIMASYKDTSFQIGNSELLTIRFINDSNSRMRYKFEMIYKEKIENVWKVKNDTIFTAGYDITIDSIAIVNIGNKKYLYYEENQPGGSLGNNDFEFVLLDFKAFNKYYIHYAVFPEGSIVKKEFTNSENLDAQKELLTFLENKGKVSKKIYIPDKKDLIIEKFIEDNQNSLAKIDDQFSINSPIKFIKNSTKIVLFQPNKKVSPAGEQTISYYLHNKDYVIISLFKGPVLGYQKSTNEYFCIWTPKSLYDWVVYMEFDKSGKLIIFDKDDKKQKYIIDLNSFIFMRLK